MDLKGFVKEYWKEITLLLVLVMLFFMEPGVGVSYSVLEILWIFTAMMTAVKYKGAKSILMYFKQHGFAVNEALEAATPDDKEGAWKWFVLNRSVAYIQPLLGLTLALFVFKTSLADGWYGYLYMCIDLLHTSWSIPVLRQRLWPKPFVRTATVDDLPRLLEIDEIAFPEEAQRANEGNFRRRIESSSDTNLVLVDSKSGIVGVIYCRPVNLEKLLSKKHLRWCEIANDGDFTAPDDADALYVVGIASVGGLKYNVSTILEAAAGRLAVRKGYKAVLGALRIPGFHKSDLTLDQYVIASREGLPIDPLLRTFVKGATLPLLGSLVQVFRGIEEYFPDAESKNCAALIGGYEPVRQRLPGGGWLLDQSLVLRVAWGYLFEKLMLL